MIDNVSIGIAFLAGLVSFLSPCVLPLVPGFLAYLSGASLTETGAKKRVAIFVNSLFFVLGFSSVFAALGVLLNTLLEGIAYDVQLWMSRIGGVIIIFFGLYLTKLLRFSFLEREHKVLVKHRFKSRLATSYVFGAAFAAGWTPCVGAALGAILGLAATQPGAALYLLFSYSLGLGIPFLVVGMFAAQASGVINRYAKTLVYVNIVFGIVLVILGMLIFTQNLNILVNFNLLNRVLLNA